jgi:Ca2+/Na+ antiporter
MSLTEIINVIILIIIIIYLMTSTGIIVDKYLITSLENVCKKYDLTQTTQGYLLAIGSSIPEFATNLMATLTSKSNIGIGAIFGSGAFNLTLGFGIASFFTKNYLKLSFSYYTRDIFVYLCSLFCLNIFLSTKRINVYQIMTLILLWPIYIMSVNICQKD